MDQNDQKDSVLRPAAFNPLDGVDIPLLKQITLNLQEGVFVLNTEGQLLFINAEGERLLGWSMAELLGKNMHDAIHFQTPQGVRIPANDCPVQKSLINGQTYHVKEETFIHRDGHILPVSFTATPVLKRGKVAYSVTTFQDLIRRKQAEREIKQARDIALETSRLRSEFLANMSHEIRTPINGVIGMTDLLISTKLQKEQREMASTARESAQALLTVVNDILDFSRLEGGKLDIQSVDFRPEKLVGEVADLQGSQAQKKGLQLDHHTSVKVPSYLQGDPARIRQVLLNLAGNAIKFTKKGSISIRARVEKKTKAQVVLRFMVTDTGIGIPKSARHRLFQPFTQVDGSRSRSFGGTGLGLSISSRLVELMGGEIGFSSKKGKGSVFWFTVPLARTSQQSIDCPQTIRNNALKGIKALVVDPHQISQTVTLNHLLEWKMKGTAVESGEEALAFLKHEAVIGHPCDLVLISSTNLDTSIALAKTITHDTQLPPASLLLLTRTREKKRLEEARKAGFISHLNRPVSGPQLQQCLLSLFNPKPEDISERSSQDLSSTSSQESPHESEGGKSILLAEDNAIIQKMVQMQLNRLGFSVQIVANGKEAVQTASTNNCSLILMDCNMPVMDGYQAAQAIRNKKGKGSKLPIIAMTAGTEHGEESRIKEFGMDDFLTKPIQIESLAEKLETWFPKKEHQPWNNERGPDDDPIELSRLSENFGDDKVVIREFLTVYLRSTHTLLDQIKENLIQKDRQKLLDNALILKGSSANIGAVFMTQLCGYLEREKEGENWKSIQQIVAEMGSELQQIETFINTLDAAN
ncbi:MAG: response regulator [Magnetococcales bacterium]|nr:response regulator [Magnetococcales bacterium]